MLNLEIHADHPGDGTTYVIVTASRGNFRWRATTVLRGERPVEELFASLVEESEAGLTVNVQREFEGENLCCAIVFLKPTHPVISLGQVYARDGIQRMLLKPAGLDLYWYVGSPAKGELGIATISEEDWIEWITPARKIDFLCAGKTVFTGPGDSSGPVVLAWDLLGDHGKPS